MAKNTHLEHLEDDILNSGTKGGHNAIKFLKELGKMLSEPTSSIKVTTKWDGAPAIVCGIDPGNGQFFVGTKSVFNKTGIPKVCYSDYDVDYFGYEGDLAKKLKICLKHLSKMQIKGVLQGDLLFSGSDKKSQRIDGKQCISFQPNTITYCVEKGSAIYKNVESADLGIVFHTSYSGSDLASMNASFGVEKTQFGSTPTVYAATATFNDVTGSTNFTKMEKTTYDKAINKAVGSLKQASKFLDILGGQGDGRFLFSTLFKQYFNTFIRKGKAISNVQQTATGFSQFYAELLDKEIAKKKTKATQDKYKKIKVDGLKFLTTYKTSIYMTVASYMNIIAAKSLVIKQLNKVEGIGTYIKTDTGFKVTAPEGFVAIKSGSALKLVDRLEFSRANFTVEKNWG